MNQRTTSVDTATAYLPPMLLLFVGSGCAALIYEVVWFQLLQLVIGSSAISLGVLLGTFMGGMCLGSYLLPRYIGVEHHPLRVYALLEIAIGVFGLLLLFGMPLVNGIYGAIGGGNIFVRAIVAAVCLLPPTIMMGATLPAVARYVETTPQGVSWLGFFYGGNIAEQSAAWGSTRESVGHAITGRRSVLLLLRSTRHRPIGHVADGGPSSACGRNASGPGPAPRLSRAAPSSPAGAWRTARVPGRCRGRCAWWRTAARFRTRAAAVGRSPASRSPAPRHRS